MDPSAYKVFMDPYYNSSFFLVLYSSVIACVLFVIVFKTLRSGKGKNLPPGSLGLPLIGETLSFLRARYYHKDTEWIGKRVAKYGPVFKTSLMGYPTVMLTGPAGNRFLFQTDSNSVINRHHTSLSMLLGEYNILNLNGDIHKRVRGACMQFLKPEALQKFVGRMDAVIRQHLADGWEGKESITMLPLAKELSFEVACDLLFGLTDKEEMKLIGEDYGELTKGVWKLPFDLPGTTFRHSLKARSNILRRLRSYCETRRRELQQGKVTPRQDLMSTLLSMRDENDEGLTEEEILDNLLAVMLAGHEATATTLTNMVRMLALNPNIRENIYKEQMEILAGKDPNENLRWEDVQNMKYTWKAAQETLRLLPPALGAFRKAVRDVEYGGYTIPKGWQLFWNAGITHLDGEIFKDPNKFDPSHFDKPIPPYNFVAFGGGSRMCAGYELAKMESLVLMHRLVCNYKWSMEDPDESIVCFPAPTPVNGLPLKIQPIVK